MVDPANQRLSIASFDYPRNWVAKRAIITIDTAHNPRLVVELAIRAISHILYSAKSATLVLCHTECVSCWADNIFNVASLSYPRNRVAKCAVIAINATRNSILVVEFAIRAVSHILYSAKSATLVFIGTKRIPGWPAKVFSVGGAENPQLICLLRSFALPLLRLHAIASCSCASLNI